MKLTKTQLRNMISEAVQQRLNESSTHEQRFMRLDRFRSEVSLSSRELLEDLVEMLDDSMWKQIVSGLKEKYGYKV